MRRALPALVLVLGALGPLGCPEDTALVGGCLDDAECVSQNGPGWICSDQFNPSRCECTTDSACGKGAFCNDAGQCQADVGCYTNDECAVDQFCDATNRQCIEDGKGKCTSDLQCPIGELCDVVSHYCVSGCREAGDCPLGMVCRCPDGAAACEAPAIGECRAHPPDDDTLALCDDDTFCRWGEFCLYDDTVEDTVCVAADGPYCDPCTTGAGQGLSLCGTDAANYCLVDTSVPGGLGSYCGVACDQEADCPNGFGCHFVVILTQALCSVDTDCPATGGACTTDADCPGGRCDPTEERCAGKCAGHEGGAAGTGYCSCVQDLDCPQDTCDTQERVCGLTRTPCMLDGSECRGQLSCVNINGVGGCVIGKNCAPDEGISCAMVRTQ